MKAALDVKTARACFTAIDADGFSQATCELLSAGVDQAMDSSPCADCAATLSLAARVVAGAASWMPRPNPPPRPSAPADGGAGPTVPVDDAAAAADENQLCARLGCGKSGAEQRCSRCKRTQYCGTDCQRTHWKVGGHKTLCTPIPQGGDVPTPAVPPQHLETYYRWLLFFSRDPQAVPCLARADVLELLLYGMLTAADQGTWAHAGPAGKALSNLLLQVELARQPFVRTRPAERIIAWLEVHAAPSEATADLKVVQIRLLFLLFATTAHAVAAAKQGGEGLHTLVRVVKLQVEAAAAGRELTESEAGIINEGLKCIFCLTNSWSDPAVFAGTGEAAMSEARAAYAPILAAFAEVAALARRTIMAVSPDQHKILSSAIELFVNTPRGTFESVLGAEPNLDAVVRVATRRSHDSKATSITERHWDPDKPGEVTETRWDRPVDDDGDDAGVTAPAAAGGDAAPPVGGGPVEPADYAVLDRILEHLQHVLGNGDDDLPSTVSPILVVLKNIAQENAFVRRYLKPRVAPRERDLSLKPEDGASLRAMLTKHLTSYDSNLKQTVAELFYVLCNGNIHRLVRRTGFGNAAGFLTTFGITGVEELSSIAGDDSDTESEPDDDVNPVTGRLWQDEIAAGAEAEEPEMSEEQKEVAAHELMQLFGRLNDLGIIKAQLPQPE